MRHYACAFVLLATPLAAGPPQLSLPIDCTLGESCYIEDYVDAQPGRGQRDYTCGPKTREEHRGTDIGLLTHAAMERGVNVLAAAPGVVRATRDGIEDRPYSAEIAESLKGRECGNAVAIVHQDGWQTLYCHLMQGSVQVREGDRVARGAVLGRVGMSGQSNFPHVHIGVMQGQRVVDPFAPDLQPGQCGESGTTLWQEPPAYSTGGLFTAGFDTEVPSFEAVVDGSARVTETGPDAPALVLYGDVFLAAPGDVLQMKIVTPEGRLMIDQEVVLDDPNTRLYRALGKKRPDGGWSPGLYRGRITHLRDGRVIAMRHADLVVSE